MSQTETQNEPEPDVDQKQHHQKEEEDMIIDGIDGPDNGPGTGADDDGLPNGPNEDDSLSLSDDGDSDDQQSTPTPTTIPPLHRFLDNSSMPPPQKVENVEDMLSWAAMFFEQLNKARSGSGIDVEFFVSVSDQ